RLPRLDAGAEDLGLEPERILGRHKRLEPRPCRRDPGLELAAVGALERNLDRPVGGLAGPFEQRRLEHRVESARGDRRRRRTLTVLARIDGLLRRALQAGPHAGVTGPAPREPGE